MIKQLSEFYLDAFRGLSKEIWLLAAATFVNRAGTMVIPFIALYLTAKLNFSLIQVGWVMTWYGVGSLLGSWIGGKLSDIISFHKVMVFSLFVTGILFFILFEFKTYYGFCSAILILMIVADTFRPAAYKAMGVYSKPENRTRSISLVRLAINLGFSFGPAVGGVLIYNFGYRALFYIDALTCIIASILLLVLLAPQKIGISAAKLEPKDKNASVWRDYPYLLLVLILFIVDVIFMQLFSTVPLFYRDEHRLTERTIGLLIALNGFLIFLTEMPLVSFLERIKVDKLKVVLVSCVFIAFSYFALNLGLFFWVLIVSMTLITIGEMMGFPFSNSFSLDRAPKNRVGEYMGLYTIAFSASHIVGPNLGMRISEHYGFTTTWYVMGGLGLVAGLLCIVLIRVIRSESQNKEESL